MLLAACRYDGVKRRLIAQRIAAFSQKLLKRRLPGQLRLCVLPGKMQRSQLERRHRAIIDKRCAARLF